MHCITQPIAAPEGATVRYRIECEGSSFTVQAFASGLLSSFAHNPTIAIPDFSGEVFFNAETIEQSSLRMVIHAPSLTVSGDQSKKDREEIDRKMHEEVLESESFPDIVYRGSRLSASKMGEGQYRGTMEGELGLHGVTRHQPIAMHISLNGDALRVTGDFSIRQSDYEIRQVSAAAGTIKLKDELKFAFDISARKKP